MTKFEKEFYFGIMSAQSQLCDAAGMCPRNYDGTCEKRLSQAVVSVMAALIVKELHALDWMASTTFGKPNATYEEFCKKKNDVKRLVSALRTFEDSAGLANAIIYGLDDGDEPIPVDWL